MKNIKRSLFIILIIVLSIFIYACGKENEPNDGLDKYTISLDKSSMEIELYTEYTFDVLGEFDGSITWTTSNNSVVEVNNGTILATGIGSAVVKATVGEGDFKAEASCDILVVQPSHIDFIVNYDSITLDIGQAITFSAQIIANNNNVDAQYSFSTTDTAMIDTENVSNGRYYVSAKEYGNAEIIVQAQYLGQIYTKKIKVNIEEAISLDWATEGIEINNGLYCLTLDRVDLSKSPVVKTEKQLAVDVYKSNEKVAGATISWSSANTSVVSVNNNGLVSVVGVGNTVVTATYHSNVTQKDYEKKLNISVNINDAENLSNTQYAVQDEAFYINSTLVTVAYDSETYDKVYESANGFWDKTGDHTVYFECDNKLYFGKVVVANKLINNVTEFTSFVDEVRNTASAVYKNKVVLLTADIDMTSYAGWKDLNQDKTVGFAGTFDGLNHTIYGGSYGQSGMFKGITATGVVKNLTIVAPKIQWGYSGVVTSTLAGIIDNVSIIYNGAVSTNNTILNEACLFAWNAVDNAVITNCTVKTDSTFSTWFVRCGGFAYSNNNVFSENGWINSISVSGHIANITNTLTIDGETIISTNAKDGAKVSLITANGVKTLLSTLVSDGKVTLNSSDIDSTTYENAFFVEIELENGYEYIVVKLA